LEGKSLAQTRKGEKKKNKQLPPDTGTRGETNPIKKTETKKQKEYWGGQAKKEERRKWDTNNNPEKG